MKRNRAVLTITVALLAVATTAAAFLAFREDTAADTFGAQAIGSIDIGNAATEGIFPVTVPIDDLTPGTAYSACVNAIVIDPQPGDDPRIFVAGVTGNLAQHLQITARIRTDAEVTTPGQDTTDCPGSASYAVWAPLQTLDAFAASFPDYETGEPFVFPTNAQVKVSVFLDAGVDPTLVMGESATLSVAFENRRNG